MKNEDQSLRARIGAWIALILTVGGTVAVIILAATDHRHRAVITLVGVLAGMAAIRLWTPGRPWFSSRGRILDSLVYVVLALVIWYLAPYTSTLAVR